MISHIRRRRLVSVVGGSVLLALSFPVPPVHAQDDKKASFDPKAAQEGGLGMPTPFDKFLALDQVLSGSKVDWAGAFRKTAVDLDPDSFTDKEIAIPMALGVRIADGVMAIKARDAELLNKCAADIENLAGKMGISNEEMGRARAARAAANGGEWLKVFMELGFFQQEIMKKLDEKANSSRGTLLIVSGWMQGARYTTAVIEEHYTPEASNILREPLLARALKEKVDALPDNVKKNPAVAKIRDVLPKVEKILTIPLDGTISKENVGEINNLSTEAVKAAVGAAS